MLAFVAGIEYAQLLEVPMDKNEKAIFEAARASKGGKERMSGMTQSERHALASSAAKARWAKKKAGITVAGQSSGYEPIILSSNQAVISSLPVARWPGVLSLGVEIPCYV